MMSQKVCRAVIIKRDAIYRIATRWHPVGYPFWTQPYKLGP
jgi:hypothetical protein